MSYQFEEQSESLSQTLPAWLLIKLPPQECIPASNLKGLTAPDNPTLIPYPSLQKVKSSVLCAKN